MIEAKVVGIEDLKAALSELPARLRKRALLSALRKAAGLVRTAARSRAPLISATHPMVRRGWRKPGTLRRAISVRPSGRDRRSGNVGVFVNVRPAKKGARGAKNPNDPFYWRWVEFGRQARTKGERVTYATGGRLKVRKVRRTTQGQPAVEFLQKSAEALPAALSRFRAEIAPAIQRLNVRRAEV